MKQELTQEYLKSILHYDQDSGVFTWLSREDKKGPGGMTWNTRYAGKEAGYTNKKGYIDIMIKKIPRRAHRLAWLYVYGYFPLLEIDHKDNIRHHNWIKNLREATRQENMQNQKKCMATNTTTGLLGSSFNKYRKKYVSQICVNGKTKYLGYFEKAQQAHDVYVAEKRKLHPFGEI